jgi:H+/Cl- antiporter ClcA
MGSGVICVVISCALTIYIGPGAIGSGTPEVMGVLNGVNYRGIIGFRTLFVKYFGTLFAVVGGICIGKEGPLAHIGAIVGVMVTYMPFKQFRVLQNDVIRRQMIAAGASVGVSCAFGAPIGGALFSYEISKPNTFWTFSMLWRVFFATSLGTFTLSILQSLAKGAPHS